ncbi:XAC2610-related protein, partial [Vibrio parahaemolyticus]
NGKGINQAYYAWLFNPVKEKFEPCEQLENITSPEVDDNKKLIYSNWKGGAGNFVSDIYEYKKGKYILMSSLELNRYVHKKDTILL